MLAGNAGPAFKLNNCIQWPTCTYGFSSSWSLCIIGLHHYKISNFNFFSQKLEVLCNWLNLAHGKYKQIFPDMRLWNMQLVGVKMGHELDICQSLMSKILDWKITLFWSWNLNIGLCQECFKNLGTVSLWFWFWFVLMPWYTSEISWGEFYLKKKLSISF